MKTTRRFMSLFGCLACLGMGGSAYADAGNLRSVISDNLIQSQKTTHPREMLTGPEKPKTEVKGGMLFVPPSPDVDYKIATVPPDPNIDYKIGFAHSWLRSPLAGSNSLPGDMIRNYRRQK